MARIRTIKPEFFTSLSINDLSPLTRLTFIGIWTHVDDEGRCIDDARLIKAAVSPLERTVPAIEADLIALADQGRVIRYDGDGKRLLQVANWDEHQYINRPRPSKFPAPTGIAHGGITEHARTAHARKGKEGKGTKEREGNGVVVASVTPSTDLALHDAPTAQTLVGEWIDHCDTRPPRRVIGQVSKELKALLDEGIDPARVRAALAEWNRKGLHPSTLASVVHEMTNRKPANRGQAATDELFDAAMLRALEKDAS